MRWSLFVRELRQYRSTFIVWTLTIAGLTVITMAAMPTMLSNLGAMQDYLKVFPKEFMRAFSFDLSTFADPLGFYVVYATLYTMLLGSVFSVTVTASILHKEQSLGTADFLMAKPISRGQILATKVAAYLAMILAFNLLTFLAGWACLKGFAPFPFRTPALLIVSTYALLLMLAMGAIGIAVSLLVQRMKSMTGIGIGIVLGFYLIDVAAKITAKYESYGWVSPFKWVDLDVTRPGYAFQGWRLLLFGALILGGFGSAALIYRRKDILS